MWTRRRRLAAGALLAVAVTLASGLSGCTGPSASDARRVADWIGAQPHVASAESSVSTDPWNRWVSFVMRVDPVIGDEELTALANAAARRAQEAGLDNPSLQWYLGDDQAFSELGGDATLAVFLGLRHDPRFLAVGARGNAPCGDFYCVSLASTEPAVLLGAAKRMLALAADAGGVQSNLEFRAVSADGLFAVEAEPLAPADAAVALWQRIAASGVAIQQARAWTIEPVGDIPPSQLLNLTVADAPAASAAEAIAGTFAAEQRGDAAAAPVELRVTALDGSTPELAPSP